MICVTYIEADGTSHDVHVDAGISVMEAAVRNNISAIEGECGGAAACATCHVYIPAEWQALTGSASEDELAMLEFGEGVDERSRLGCQITITQEMNGMTVLTPVTQR